MDERGARRQRACLGLALTPQGSLDPGGGGGVTGSWVIRSKGAKGAHGIQSITLKGRPRSGGKRACQDRIQPSQGPASWAEHSPPRLSKSNPAGSALSLGLGTGKSPQRDCLVPLSYFSNNVMSVTEGHGLACGQAASEQQNPPTRPGVLTPAQGFSLHQCLPWRGKCEEEGAQIY